jgi:histidine triad (HIT) family protein
MRRIVAQSPAVEGCLFCRIIAGDAPGDRVLDEEQAVAFLDTRPVFKGHVLVVPRQHIVTLMDLPHEEIEPLFGAAQRVSRAVEAGMEADGVFVGINNRISQSVFHLHVHVVPRRRKDGLRGFFWPRTRYDSAEEAAEVARRIRDSVV